MIAWLLAAGCLIVAVVTTLSFLRDWRMALASHFRPQLAAASLALAILVSFTALPGWAASLAALLALLATAANLFAIWRVLPHLSSGGGETGVRLRLGFANLLATNKNRTAIVDWVKLELIDVLVVCEAVGDWPDALVAGLADELPYGTTAPLGDLMILSRRPLGEIQHPVTRFGNAILAETDTDAGPLTIVGVHATTPGNAHRSTGRDAMIETVGHVAWRRNGGIVIAGDFNATPWSIPMRRLMRGSRLAYGPGAFRGTFPAWLPDWAGLSIDHVMAGGGWRVASQRHGPRIGSDHWPILAELVAPKR